MGEITLTLSEALTRAVTLHQSGDLVQAEQIYRKIIGAKPNHFEALHWLGVLRHQCGHHEEADRLVKQAIALNPHYAEAYSSRGAMLGQLKRRDEALASFDKAIALKPDYAVAHYNRGNALLSLKRLDEALASYDKAIALKPDYTEAYYNRGNALLHLKRLDKAIASYDEAIALNPDYSEAYYNRGNALQELTRRDDALASYDKAIALKPDCEFLLGVWLQAKMRICDWSDLGTKIAQLVAKVERGEKIATPLSSILLSSSPVLQRRVAEIWIQASAPSNNMLPKIIKRPRRDKIHIGYFSGDFHNHATSWLMAELLEKHHRSQFEVTAFSFGPDEKDEMRDRLAKAFHKFLDVRNNSDEEIATLARKLDIDIAVDLKGFTTDARTGIFAFRAAPIQVNYLGYPGTMAAEYIDYLIGDLTLVPGFQQKYYSEKIAYLPDSYQANDTKRRIADKVFTRAELGLPQDGFIFCCFNNNYKITPDVFDYWMKIIRQVGGSVLWLLEDNTTAAINLRKEAVRRGIAADRLVFAPRMPLPEHLARHRAADLFLDTLPCNAHTTASDALWAGLPVLTRIGETFAGRVAASLLNAIGLPELITSTPQAYEELAIELAINSDRLAYIKRKLTNNPLNAALFDINRFTRNIESAYVAMYERYQSDLPPDHIYVPQ